MSKTSNEATVQDLTPGTRIKYDSGFTLHGGSEGTVTKVTDTYVYVDFGSNRAKGPKRLRLSTEVKKITVLDAPAEVESLPAIDTDPWVRIKELHRELRTLGRKTLEVAIEMGETLTAAKAECPHGQWLPKLSEAGIAERSAQGYMRLYRKRDKLANAQALADFGIEAALEYLAERKREPAEPEPDPKAIKAPKVARDADDEPVEAEIVEVANGEYEMARPTSDLARLGRKNPEMTRRSTEVIGSLSRLARFCESNDPAEVASFLLKHEWEPTVRHAAAIVQWLCRLTASGNTAHD